MTQSREQQIQSLQQNWQSNPRWGNVTRTYDAETIIGLRGSVQPEHVFAGHCSRKLWDLLRGEPFVNALGALTGAQAVQQVKAGLKGIYLSGWQVAADANGACEMYPDQSLYSVDSVPTVVKRVINAFRRADQIQWAEGQGDVDSFVSIVAMPKRASAAC
jgi:isocitrate lyase